MKEYLKRYIEELKAGQNLRIMDRRSPDFPYQKWAFENGSRIREKLGIEAGGLTIMRWPLTGEE